MKIDMKGLAKDLGKDVLKFSAGCLGLFVVGTLINTVIAPVERPTTTRTLEMSTQSVTDEEAEFVSAVKELPEFKYDSDIDILKLGESVCHLLDTQGEDTGEKSMHALGESKGYSRESIAYLLDFSDLLCPGEVDTGHSEA